MLSKINSIDFNRLMVLMMYGQQLGVGKNSVLANCQFG